MGTNNVETNAQVFPHKNLTIWHKEHVQKLPCTVQISIASGVMKKITPSPKYKPKSETQRKSSGPPSLILTDSPGMDYVKQGDRDFRNNPVLKNRNQRAVERLVQKEKREERWSKNNEKVKTMLESRFFH